MALRFSQVFCILWLSSSLIAARALWGQSTEIEPTGKQSQREHLLETPEQQIIFATSTVWARPLSESASAVTVFDRQQIEELGVRTVAELLNFAPGLFVSDTGARAGLAAAQIRGGDPNFTLVLLDGVPINDSTDQLGGSVNLNTLPLSEVERVEISKGPLSSFFGSTAVAGAINIVTRRGDSSKGKYAVGLSAGNNSLIQGSASVAGDSEPRNFFLGASWQQESSSIGEDSFKQLNLQGSLAGDGILKSRFRLVGRVSFWEGDDYPEGSGGPILGDGEIRQSDHQELSLGLDWQIGPSDRYHQVSAKVYLHDLQRESPAIGFVVPDSVEDTNYLHLQAGWAYPLLRSGSSQASIGVGFDAENGASENTLAGFLDGDYDLDRITGSTFVEYIAETESWLFDLGLRVDVPEGFQSQLSPRIGLSYQTTERTKLRGSIARAFKLPSLFALGTPSLLGGNPDLQPEISTGGDIGFEQILANQDVTWSFNLFFIRYKDLIDFLFEPAPKLVNRGSVDARGIELSGGWQPTARIDLRGNLTWQKVEDRATSEELRNRPEWVGGLRFSWKPTVRFRLETDGRWISQRKDQQITSDRDDVPGYQIFGGGIEYKISDAWILDARVDNIADEVYETFIGFPGVGRSYRIGFKIRPRNTP